jgi:hypothetical protein
MPYTEGMDMRSKLKRIGGGAMAVIGYLLSPLSWWNDLIINIPLAYLFAYLVSFIVPGYFLLEMIVGYWLTNIAGFVIMHAGIKMSLLKEGKTDFMKYLLISLLYTLLMVGLYYLGVASFPSNYHLQ